MLRLGLVILSLGVMMGDSEDLVIPTVLVAVGIALMFMSKEVRHEQADTETEDSQLV